MREPAKSLVPIHVREVLVEVVRIARLSVAVIVPVRVKVHPLRVVVLTVAVLVRDRALVIAKVVLPVLDVLVVHQLVQTPVKTNVQPHVPADAKEIAQGNVPMVARGDVRASVRLPALLLVLMTAKVVVMTAVRQAVLLLVTEDVLSNVQASAPVVVKEHVQVFVPIAVITTVPKTVQDVVIIHAILNVRQIAVHPVTPQTVQEHAKIRALVVAAQVVVNPVGGKMLWQN